MDSKGEDDEADSDSTTSASSTDLQQTGKTDGASGTVGHEVAIVTAVTTGAAASSHGAFDTSAIKHKLSVKRPPGGKVCFDPLFLLLLETCCPAASTATPSWAYRVQMSKKALMERAKEDRKKSDTGDKAKSKPKVLFLH